jgi:hypothetical protein
MRFSKNNRNFILVFFVGFGFGFGFVEETLEEIETRTNNDDNSNIASPMQ